MRSFLCILYWIIAHTNIHTVLDRSMLQLPVILADCTLLFKRPSQESTIWSLQPLLPRLPSSLCAVDFCSAQISRAVPQVGAPGSAYPTRDSYISSALPHCLHLFLPNIDTFRRSRPQVYLSGFPPWAIHASSHTAPPM
jgi:hypothetical protein